MTRLVCGGLFVLLAATVASAATLKVPQDHETIQAAIDAAEDGDQIVVGRGDWNEAIRATSRKNLTIVGKKARVLGDAGESILRFKDCANITIKGFTFAGGPGHGAHLVECRDIEFLKCRFEEVDEDGLRADDCSGIIVFKCLFEDCGEDGLTLSGRLGATQTNDCLVERCVFRGGGDDSVSLNGSDNRFYKCKSFDSGDDGFDLAGYSLDGNGGTGTGGGNVFEKCVAVAPDVAGFSLGEGFSENRLIRCKVLVEARNGFDVEGDDNVLTRCSVKNAENDGFNADGNGNLFDQCKATGSLQNGFDLEGDGNRFEGCQAKSGDNTGFQIRPDAEGNVFQGNKASRNRKFDLRDFAGEGKNTFDGTNKFKTFGP